MVDLVGINEERWLSLMIECVLNTESSNKRNGVGPDNPKGSKSSDMDQNQKDDPYSIAYCVVALNDMSGIDRRLTI
ncbi:hypothetical protein H5410_032321 [Solanum commersonii]|uniref:Uncharacterized protein n=1 Tax=Solanum commersonii TaxID=4109 RepID=A0A9J5YMJ7_SOLCO|nr:hypothetical protein H5410_032321 [Solanum commersonii]